MDNLEDTITALRLLTPEQVTVERSLLGFIYECPAVIWMKDYRELAGRYVFVSREWERVYGRKRAEAVGHTDYDFMPRKEADKIRLVDKEVLEIGRRIIVNDPIGTRGSNWQAMRTALFPIRSSMEKDWDHVGGIGVGRDHIDV